MLGNNGIVLFAARGPVLISCTCAADKDLIDSRAIVPLHFEGSK